MKKIIIAVVIAFVLVAILLLSATPQQEGVSKITVTSNANKLEVTKYEVKSSIGNNIKSAPLTKNEFKEIEQLVLSKEFEALNARYEANLPKGQVCTQASFEFSVDYTFGRSKTIFVEGCTEEPAIMHNILLKIPRTK